MGKILKLSLWKKFAVDMIILAFSSIIITFLSLVLPKRLYNYKNWMYKVRKWEKNGEFYQRVFNVKAWKSRAPELADFLKFIFPKKYIKEYESQYMSKYLIESCRAEFTHWCIILSSVIFLICDDVSTFLYMLLITIILNLPFIIIQRYNRPRIMSIMKHKGMEV